MTCTRRGLLASMPGLLAFDTFTARLGNGSDFAILGVSTAQSVDVTPSHLPGEWKDEGWIRALWRFAPGASAGELIASRIHKDGSMDHFRGSVLHAKGRVDVLDLTPAAAHAPGDASPHMLLKLEMTQVDAISVGTRRRVRKEFGNHPGKSFYRLRLTPARASGLRDLADAPKPLPEPASGPSAKDVVISATPAQVAAFLDKHAGDSSCWKGSGEATRIVRRLAEES